MLLGDIAAGGYRARVGKGAGERELLGSIVAGVYRSRDRERHVQERAFGGRGGARRMPIRNRLCPPTLGVLEAAPIKNTNMDSKLEISAKISGNHTGFHLFPTSS